MSNVPILKARNAGEALRRADARWRIRRWTVAMRTSVTAAAFGLYLAATPRALYVSEAVRLQLGSGRVFLWPLSRVVGVVLVLAAPLAAYLAHLMREKAMRDARRNPVTATVLFDLDND